MASLAGMSSPMALHAKSRFHAHDKKAQYDAIADVHTLPAHNRQSLLDCLLVQHRALEGGNHG